MPFITVVPGTVITASWGNMVRDQLVTPFASDAARTAAVGALATEGMTSWLMDYDDLWVHDGAVNKPIAGPPTAFKSIDETISNDAVVHDDNELFVSAAPNAFYKGELWLSFTANAAAGLKVIFSGPAGATMRSSGYLVVVAGVSTFNTTNALGSVNGITATGAPLPYMNKFTLTTTNAGFLNFQWAQDTAHLSNATVHAGSYLKLERIG